MIMPYLFFDWGHDLYLLDDILEVAAKDNNKRRAWVFVLRRALQPEEKMAPLPTAA